MTDKPHNRKTKHCSTSGHRWICNDILIRRAVLAHGIDAQEQSVLGAEDLFDAALGLDLRLPFRRRERCRVAV